MRIHDYNLGPPPAAVTATSTATPAPSPVATLPKRTQPASGSGDPLACAEAQIALLQARIGHLEAVIEAARGLMTSNQERLLRRLHETPREIAALSTRLDRLGAGSNPAWYESAGTPK